MGTSIGRIFGRGAMLRLVIAVSATVVAATMAAATVALAQSRTTTLSGVVSNLNGVPIPRAEVIIVNTELRAFSNDSGVYEFMAVPVGRVRIIARRIGFEPEEERVSLDVGRHKQVDFELKGIPELLDSVMIREAGGNGRMSDFWARRMLGVGAFITRQDIERRHPQRSSDLLRTITGVKVMLGDNAMDRSVITMGRTGTVLRQQRPGSKTLVNSCDISYYVDGSYVPPGTFHMDDMSPLAIEAVEVYRGPSETPARLRQRDTACGVIVIWTREPPAKQPVKPRDHL